MTRGDAIRFRIACALVALAMAGLFWFADVTLSLLLTSASPQRNAPAVTNGPVRSTLLPDARGQNFSTTRKAP